MSDFEPVEEDQPSGRPPRRRRPQQSRGPGRKKKNASGGIERMIPSNNIPALIGYYIGILALIPCVGIILSIPAIVLGVMGLRKFSEDPSVHGKTHSIVALVLGGFSLLAYGGGILFMIVASALDQ
ncbi:hypothetical protein [Stratiformator vulcanicus]|uniref:DUF4190 domain-containing protein n=1 Tax=Stratiformator vulcanicus TaxID=2527980 RepID=A0A517QYE5_9PLAN|nr:hypothetical protein [Stratiformator vulcanicus]QDT36618.1 hypothetical protein Pan189_09780 [Stratiformator vulcanicus]